MNTTMNVPSLELGVPTQAMLAALSHLQTIPVKATQESAKLSEQILRLTIALRVQAPDLGRVVNIYA